MCKLHINHKTLAATAMQQEKIWNLGEVLLLAAFALCWAVKAGGQDGQHEGCVPYRGGQRQVSGPLI